MKLQDRLLRKRLLSSRFMQKRKATIAPAERIRETADAIGDAVSRRAKLNWKKPGKEVSKPALNLLARELSYLARSHIGQTHRPVFVSKAAQSRVVILLPGFGTGPKRMRFMAQQLERAGHTVKHWGLGHNFGPSEENFKQLITRLDQVHERYGEKIYLVGWSLGGVFARELAKVRPELVAKVVTMGSPFSHSPYSNNVWRAYQMITGHSVETPPIGDDLKAKPPVETVALWSPRDALIAPRAARGEPGERDRALALRCTHIGFCDSPEVIATILDELE